MPPACSLPASIAPAAFNATLECWQVVLSGCPLQLPEYYLDIPVLRTCVEQPFIHVCIGDFCLNTCLARLQDRCGDFYP